MEKLQINDLYDFDKIRNNLKNPEKGDTYLLYDGWLTDGFSSTNYVTISIAKVKKNNLFYYKNLTRYKIPINELENIILTGPVGTIEFYNYYDYQNHIESEKLKPVSE